MSVYILLSYLTSSSSIRVISNNLWTSLKLSRARDETSFGLPSNPSIDNFALPAAISAGVVGETRSSTRNEGRFYSDGSGTRNPPGFLVLGSTMEIGEMSLSNV